MIVSINSQVNLLNLLNLIILIKSTFSLQSHSNPKQNLSFSSINQIRPSHNISNTNKTIDEGCIIALEDQISIVELSFMNTNNENELVRPVFSSFLVENSSFFIKKHESIVSNLLVKDILLINNNLNVTFFKGGCLVYAGKSSFYFIFMANETEIKYIQVEYSHKDGFTYGIPYVLIDSDVPIYLSECLYSLADNSLLLIYFRSQGSLYNQGFKRILFSFSLTDSNKREISIDKESIFTNSSFSNELLSKTRLFSDGIILSISNNQLTSELEHYEKTENNTFISQVRYSFKMLTENEEKSGNFSIISTDFDYYVNDFYIPYSNNKSSVLQSSYILYGSSIIHDKSSNSSQFKVRLYQFFNPFLILNEEKYIDLLNIPVNLTSKVRFIKSYGRFIFIGLSSPSLLLSFLRSSVNEYDFKGEVLSSLVIDEKAYFSNIILYEKYFYGELLTIPIIQYSLNNTYNVISLLNTSPLLCLTLSNENSCVLTCPSNKIISFSTGKCVSCGKELKILNNQCVSTCIYGLNPDGITCSDTVVLASKNYNLNKRYAFISNQSNLCHVYQSSQGKEGRKGLQAYVNLNGFCQSCEIFKDFSSSFGCNSSLLTVKSLCSKADSIVTKYIPDCEGNCVPDTSISLYENVMNGVCNICEYGKSYNVILNICEETCTQNTVKTSHSNECACLNTDVLNISNITSPYCDSTCQSGILLPTSSQSQRACKKCKDGEYVEDNACVSLCKPGNVLKNNTLCVECSVNEVYFNNTCYSNCSSISLDKSKVYGDYLVNSTKTCIECEGNSVGSYLSHEGKCVSQCESYYGDINSSRVCELCKSKSKLAFNSTCLDVCPTGFLLKKDESGNLNCVKCYYENGLCVETCQVRGNVKTSNMTCLNCPAGTFESEFSTCLVNCPVNKRELVNVNNNNTGYCGDCSLFSPYYENKSCVSECKVKGYIKNKLTNTCEPCTNNTYAYNNTCISQCPPDKITYNKDLLYCLDCENQSDYIENNKCVSACAETRSFKEDTSKTCVKCEFSKYFYNSSCLDVCPNKTVGYNDPIVGLVCVACLSGEVVEDNVCVKSCLKPYNTVNEGDWRCDSCKNGLFLNLEKEKCVEKCGENSFSVVNVNGNYCSLCDSSRKYRLFNECLLYCPDGYVSDEGFNCVICKSNVFNAETRECVDDCKSNQIKERIKIKDNQSINQTQVYRCKSCSLIENNRCVNNCSNGYSNINGICILNRDPLSSYMLNSSFISKCPAGYVSDYKRICVKCKNEDCSESCAEGYVFNKERFICSLCESRSIVKQVSNQTSNEIQSNQTSNDTQVNQTLANQTLANQSNQTSNETQSNQTNQTQVNQTNQTQSNQTTYENFTQCYYECPIGFADYSNSSNINRTTSSNSTIYIQAFLSSSQQTQAQAQPSLPNFKCIKCKLTQNGRCVEDCSSFYSNKYIENNKLVTTSTCERCKTKGKQYQNGICVDFCSQNYIYDYDSFACIGCDSIQSSNNTYCQNNSTCNIVDNSLLCICNEGFFGKYCQFNIKNRSEIVNSLQETYIDLKSRLENYTNQVNNVSNISNISNSLSSNQSNKKSYDSEFLNEINQLFQKLYDINDNSTLISQFASLIPFQERLIIDSLDNTTITNQANAYFNNLNLIFKSKVMINPRIGLIIEKMIVSMNGISDFLRNSLYKNGVVYEKSYLKVYISNSSSVSLRRLDENQSQDLSLQSSQSQSSSVFIDFSNCENSSNTNEYKLIVINPSLSLFESDQIKYSVLSNTGKSYKKCKFIEIFYKINEEAINTSKILQNMLENYDYIRSNYSSDVFNKSSDFFNSHCLQFSMKNQTDTSIQMRREAFNYTIDCQVSQSQVGEGNSCQYKQIIQKRQSVKEYFINCICNDSLQSPQSESSYSSSLVLFTYNDTVKSNVKIIDCFKLTLNKDLIRQNNAFWLIFIMTILVFVCIGLYFLFQSRNYIENDLYNIIYCEFKDWSQKGADFFIFSNEKIDENQVNDVDGRKILPLSIVMKGNDYENQEKNQKKKEIDKKHSLNSSEDDDEDANKDNNMKFRNVFGVNNEEEKVREAKEDKELKLNPLKKILKTSKDEPESPTNKHNFDSTRPMLSNKIEVKTDINPYQVSFLKGILSNFLINNLVLGLFFNYSVIYSFPIRLFMLLVNTSLDFLIISCWFTDEIIKTRHEFSVKHGLSSLGIGYSFNNEIYFGIVSSILSLTLFFIFNFLIKVWHSEREGVNSSLRSKEVRKIKEKYSELHRKTLVRRVVYCILLLIVHVLCWYYFTCFVGVYPYSYYGVVNNFLICILFKYVIFDMVLCVFKAGMKEISKKSYGFMVVYRVFVL